MRKEIKSLLIMLTIFGLHVYATIGILKILNLTDNKKDFMLNLLKLYNIPIINFLIFEE